MDQQAAIESFMGQLAVGRVDKQPQCLHVPQRAWQERAKEITWLCSCGCVNKHVPLPANLRCVEDKEDA